MTNSLNGPNPRGGGWATTPRSADEIDLLGAGATTHSAALSNDEWEAIERLYQSGPREQSPLLSEARTSGILRRASHDGARLIAWLARYVEPGADPLKTLVQIAATVGLDVDAADIEWADGGGEEEGG